MPGFDRTGPEGKGSKTGRGLGKSNPDTDGKNEQLDIDERPRRFGRGNRRAGRGKGRRRGFGW